MKILIVSLLLASITACDNALTEQEKLWLGPWYVRLLHGLVPNVPEESFRKCKLYDGIIFDREHGTNGCAEDLMKDYVDRFIEENHGEINYENFIRSRVPNEYVGRIIDECGIRDESVSDLIGIHC